MLLGIHVSTGGKIYEALERAHELGCNTMQIFSRNPQRWRSDFLAGQDVAEFKRRQAKFKIRPVFVHIPYLINLASPNPRLYQASIDAYIEDMLEAQLMGAEYIVTHMGSHKDTSEQDGLKRFTEAMNTIIARTAQTKVRILLGNTAGSGSWLGYNFAHQKQIIDGLDKKEKVGLCLDTAHAYLAGYDLAVPQGLEALLAQIEETVGLSLLKLIHLNDAKGALGSHHDRHEHIGKGSIGLEGMRAIINHPKLKNIPFILETPKKEEGDELMDLNTVRKLRRGA